MGLKHFVELLRPLNCVMAGFGTFIGYSVAVGTIQFNAGIAIAMAVAFLVCGGGMAINDFFDRDIDSKMHPNKPIPSRAITPKAAFAFSFALFVFANILALLFLPLIAFAIALAFSLLFIVYSWVMGKAKYLGNFVVASGTAFTLVFGASLVGNYSIIGFLAVSALFVNTARELIKDLEDISTDKGKKVTLPMIFSKRTIEALVFIYYVAAIVFVYIPVFLLAFGRVFFVVIVSIANLLFLLSFGKMVKQDYHGAQILAKAAMFIALLGFLAGVI